MTWQDDDDCTAEPSYDPWDAVDEALDAGTDPVRAHDQARAEALAWHLAVLSESAADYYRLVDSLRRQDPARKRYMREYMREYMRKRRAAVKPSKGERDSARLEEAA